MSRKLLEYLILSRWLLWIIYIGQFMVIYIYMFNILKGCYNCIFVIQLFLMITIKVMYYR